MGKKNHKHLLTKAHARHLKEDNPKVAKMYQTGRIDHLTPFKSRTSKRGKGKPRYKDHK